MMIMMCGIDSDDRGTVMVAITMAVMLVTILVVVVTIIEVMVVVTMMTMEKLTLVMTEDTCPLSVCDPWVCISSWFLEVVHTFLLIKKYCFHLSWAKYSHP